MMGNKHKIIVLWHGTDESTAGADASVEVPKLYITYIYTLLYHDEHFCFAACKLKEWENDRLWLLLKTIDAKSQV